MHGWNHLRMGSASWYGMLLTGWSHYNANIARAPLDALGPGPGAPQIPHSTT